MTGIDKHGTEIGFGDLVAYQYAAFPAETMYV